MMSLTFGLFNQVSGLGPLGPLVQWNCRGLKANYNEILIIMSLFFSKCHLSSRNFLETVR